MLHNQSEEEMDISDKLILHDDFDSESDGEYRPLIGYDHGNDSDSDDSDDEWVNEEQDFDPYSYNTKTSSQTLQFGNEVCVPSKSAFAHQKNKKKPSRFNNKQAKKYSNTAAK